MELKDLLALHDANGIICINDDNLNCIFKGRNIRSPKLYDLEHRKVVCFGVYDNEFCVRIRSKTNEKTT